MNNLDFAVETVSIACLITRRVQSRLREIVKHTKDDRSPVTVADYAAQAYIARELGKRENDLLLVAEEDGGTLTNPDSTALVDAVVEAVAPHWADARAEDVIGAIDSGNHDASAERYWTLDPIDGTKGFLRGGQYAISLALVEQGTVTFGVLGCPNLSADHERPFDDPDPVGTLYVATATGDALSIAPGNLGQREVISVATDIDVAQMRVCESVEAMHSRQDDAARILQHIGARGAPARLDSQCKYAVVARGQADAYLRLPTQRGYVEKIWDHAAGKLVAERAGAKVTDVRGQPLDFSHGALLTHNHGVICAPPACQTAVLESIEQLGLFADSRR